MLRILQSLAFAVPIAGLLVVGRAWSAVPGRADAVVEIAAGAFGFSPARLESPAYGPDLLAVGPGGAFALWDPVRHQAFGVVPAGAALSGPSGNFALPLDHADGLAWTSGGDLLALDESARLLSRWAIGGSAGPVLVAALSMDRLCPAGVRLIVDGQLAAGIDAFGNAHPLADVSVGLAAAEGPRLLAPSHEIRVAGGKLAVDGVGLDAPADSLGARLIGDWVLVEAGQRGSVRERLAISLVSGRRVELPVGGSYQPISGVTASSDGALGFLDTRGGHLAVLRVAP